MDGWSSEIIIWRAGSQKDKIKEKVKYSLPIRRTRFGKGLKVCLLKPLAVEKSLCTCPKGANTLGLTGVKNLPSDRISVSR